MPSTRAYIYENATKRRRLSHDLVFEDVPEPGQFFIIDEEDFIVLNEFFSRTIRCSLFDSRPLSSVEEIRKAVSVGRYSRRVLKLRLRCTGSYNETFFRPLKNLTHLRHLDLSGSSGIASLPPDIGQLQHLQGLNLHRTGLLSLPPAIGQLQNLQSLDLSSTVFSSLPVEIGGLTYLETLNLEKSSIISLPPSLGRLQNLEFLSLSASSISSLSPEIGQLQNLENLDLGRTGLSSLPEEIGGLTKLKTLNLDSTRIRSLPPSIGHLRNLESLSAFKSSVRSLPPEIGELQNLENLNIGGTGLLSLPEEIGGLTNLRQLYLCCTDIRSLPPSIGQLRKLEILSLMTTKNLQVLPEGIGDLQNLEVLFLGKSAVLSKPLPDTLGRLRRLLRLQLGFLCGGTNELRDFLLIHGDSLRMLTQRCPLLGSLCLYTIYRGYDFFGETDSTFNSLLWALADNRTRYRTGFGIVGDEDKKLSPNLWPNVLSSAVDYFTPYDFLDENPDTACDYIHVPEPDAIYRLLTIGRESFLGVLVNRERDNF